MVCGYWQQPLLNVPQALRLTIPSLTVGCTPSIHIGPSVPQWCFAIHHVGILSLQPAEWSDTNNLGDFDRSCALCHETSSSKRRTATYIHSTPRELKLKRRFSDAYCNRRNFRTQFIFVYFVLSAEDTKFSSKRKLYTYTNVCDTILPVGKFVAYESLRNQEYEIFTHTKISAFTVEILNNFILL